MARERLSRVLETFVDALAEANATLGERHKEGVSYVITELDASLTYGRLDMSDEGPVVDLDDGGDASSGKVIKLRVSPVPVRAEQEEEHEEEEEEPQRPDPTRPQEIKGKNLREALRAITSSGLPSDQMVVVFDPSSDKPPGTITEYAMERDPRTGGRPRFTFTVAGRPPRGGEVEGPVIR